MSETPPPTRAAFCEEFNEDAQTTLPETRQTASTANITAKRSKPDATRGKALRDEFSDSGYSSHTGATLGSGDSSSLESRLETRPTRPDDASAASNATSEDVKKNPSDRSQSPEKPALRRTESKSKNYESTRKKTCECPECLAKKARRATPPTLDTSTTQHDSFNTRSRQMEPLSPQFQRAPRPYPTPEAPILQAAQPQARARAQTAQSHQRARPISFHAGTIPDMSYMQHPMFVERQPTPRYTMASPLPPPSYPPPQPSYFPPLQAVPATQEFFAPVAPMNSHYEVQPRPRPRMSTRPQSMYYDMSPPIMEYAQPMHQPLRSPDRPIERQSRRFQQQPPPSPRRDSTEEDDAYRKMPPPPPPPRAPSKPRQEQRPVIRHAATTSAAYPISHQHNSIRDLNGDQSTRKPTSRKQSFEEPLRSRRPSVARPPRTSDEKVAQALQLERDMAQMNIIERDPTSPKSKRRVSVYGHESLKDLEGSVEDYQASRSGRGPTSIPAGDDMLRLIRKKTLPTSTSSDAGSRISGGSRASHDGSDNKTSHRPSNDLKKRDSNDEAFAMRIPKGVNVNLQPGVEGRTISLRQSRDGDGDMELRIGERGRTGNVGVVGTRPAVREKSGKRYSIVEGQAVIEAEREPEPKPRMSISRRGSMSRRAIPEEARNLGRETGDDGYRRIVRERVITRTTSNSRRSSRSGYSGRSQNEF